MIPSSHFHRRYRLRQPLQCMAYQRHALSTRHMPYIRRSIARYHTRLANTSFDGIHDLIVFVFSSINVGAGAEASSCSLIIMVWPLQGAIVAFPRYTSAFLFPTKQCSAGRNSSHMSPSERVDRAISIVSLSQRGELPPSPKYPAFWRLEKTESSLVELDYRLTCILGPAATGRT